MNQVIADRLKKIIEDHASDNVIYILKGFGLEYYEFLTSIYRPLYSSIDNDKKLNITSLIENKRKLIKAVLNFENGVAIGLYEELILVNDTITDLTDAHLVIIENNYYDGIFPAEYDAATLKILKEMKVRLEEESLEDYEDKSFADLISEVLLIDDEVSGCYYSVHCRTG